MFARTRRLTLRPGWPEEAEALHAAIAHRAVVEKLARVPWPYTIDHARDWLARPVEPAMPVLTIHAHDLGERPLLVGGIGLHHEEDGLNLGYWLTPAAWGRGYATEAGRQVLAMARALGETRLATYHHADNPASGRVLRKLGFRETGRGRRMSLARGGEVDSVLMTLDLAEEDRPAIALAA